MYVFFCALCGRIYLSKILAPAHRITYKRETESSSTPPQRLQHHSWLMSMLTSLRTTPQRASERFKTADGYAVAVDDGFSHGNLSAQMARSILTTARPASSDFNPAGSNFHSHAPKHPPRSPAKRVLMCVARAAKPYTRPSWPTHIKTPETAATPFLALTVTPIVCHTCPSYCHTLLATSLLCVASNGSIFAAGTITSFSAAIRLTLSFLVRTGELSSPTSGLAASATTIFTDCQRSSDCSTSMDETQGCSAR